MSNTKLMSTKYKNKYILSTSVLTELFERHQQVAKFTFYAIKFQNVSLGSCYSLWIVDIFAVVFWNHTLETFRLDYEDDVECEYDFQISNQ